MAKINTKLYGDQYQTLDDFLSDFQLMFDNACRYNEPDSQVYKVVFVVNFIIILCCSYVAEIIAHTSMYAPFGSTKDE